MRICSTETRGQAAVFDVLVVGAGAAGMAAARTAALSGAHVVLAERDARPGGILPQCVHDGFGVFSWGESLTGPAYAQGLWELLGACELDVLLSCDVHSLAIEPAAEAGALAVRATLRGKATGGAGSLLARQVVLATGCYERPCASLGITGTRPAGVMTAGAAQRLMNIEGLLPGSRVVILGAGDIGAIVARRLTLEGASVAMIVGAEVTCLHRNYVQCVREMGVSLRVPWTVLSVEGSRRVEAVRIAPLDEQGVPIASQEERVPCDALLLAAGLVPRAGLLGAATSHVDGVAVSDFVQVAGNAHSIHALVDAAAAEGARAGRRAALLALGARGEVATALPEDDLSLLEVPERSLPRGCAPVVSDSAEGCICGLCPRGCKVFRVGREGGGFSYEGFGCAKGRLQTLERLGAAEPCQAFTGTVSLCDGSVARRLPVRSSVPLSAGQMAAVARAAGGVCVQGDFEGGQVVAQRTAGMPCDLVATCSSSFLAAP